MPYRPVKSRAGSPQLPTSLPFAITISSSSSSLASSTHASCAALVGSRLTASPSLPREPGSAGAAYEVQRSGNVREIVPQVAPTSSRSGWPDPAGRFSDQLKPERMAPSEKRGSHEEDPIHGRADGDDPP